MLMSSREGLGMMMPATAAPMAASQAVDGIGFFSCFSFLILEMLKHDSNIKQKLIKTIPK